MNSIYCHSQAASSISAAFSVFLFSAENCLHYKSFKFQRLLDSSYVNTKDLQSSCLTIGALGSLFYLPSVALPKLSQFFRKRTIGPITMVTKRATRQNQGHLLRFQKQKTYILYTLFYTVGNSYYFQEICLYYISVTNIYKKKIA